MKVKDLKRGDRFICSPHPDDEDNGKPYYIFMKIALVENHDIMDGNAVRLKDGILSTMPDDMEVLKVE